MRTKTYETIEHKPLSFDDHCKMFPTQRLYSKNGVHIDKCFILYSDEITKIVYFVGGDNGDTYGQLPFEVAARELAYRMSELPIEERRKYDQ